MSQYKKKILKFPVVQNEHELCPYSPAPPFFFKEQQDNHLIKTAVAEISVVEMVLDQISGFQTVLWNLEDSGGCASKIIS